MEQPSGLSCLPRELLFDIFSRFPAKELCQMTGVCKKWLSLLTSDPEFVSIYHHKHKLNPLLLHTRIVPSQNDGTSSIDLSFYYVDGTLQRHFTTNFDRKIISIISCRGIACLVCLSNIFLYDPVIDRSSYLPYSYSGSTVSIALGYAPLRREFTIIHLYEVEKFDNYHYGALKDVFCEILTKPSGEIWSNSCVVWKLLGKCQFDVLSRKSYVYVDGCVYWLIAERKFNPDCIRILVFDLEKESFGVVCFPRFYSNRSVECVGMLEMREKLCLTDRLPWETTMDIWVLENRKNNVWIKKYSMDLAHIDLHDFKILGHVPSEGGEGEILIKIGSHSFVYYDIENCNFRSLDKINMQGQDLQLLLNRKGRV
ncbi:hypothetical protein Nepgr_013307 [Nepenthes gracilis]|uniref:F-box domain-containing protein n=1 Tax=Nepenthes gracilis TaxID=150966 RepID=A0AAD3SIR5_NEPGR|nr:hypothetical protein Nepgr_013307 [Nepenthes gracilis]